MKNWRKIGVGILAFTLMSGVASAWSLGTQPGGTPNYTPGYGGGSIGGCNSDNTFCWNITLPPAPNPPYYTYPIEVYGSGAQVIVERGYHIDRRFHWDGWHYLVKTGWQSWFQYKNKVFDCAMTHQEPKQYYCKEWTSTVPW